jgi:hypothetical protein
VKTPQKPPAEPPAAPAPNAPETPSEADAGTAPEQAPAATETTGPPTSEPATPTPEPAQEPAAEPDLQVGFDSSDDEAPPREEKPRGPKLPVRVLGKDLRLDITPGIGYRGWYPQQYDLVSVDVASYFTWNIDVKAKLFGWLSLRRGYYESNGVSAPRTEEAAVAAQVGTFAPKAVWLLGVIGVPISKAWEPQIRYESRAFETRARPSEEVCVIPRSAPEDLDLDMCVGTTEDLKIISTFETFVAGVRYDHGKTGGVVLQNKGSKIPPVFFGVGLMQYRKPYQLNIDGFTLDQYLFDGRFRGAGLALGADFGGGIDNFFSEVDAQLGLGEVSLTKRITINELVPPGQLIGYLQGTASIGYRLPIIRGAPTLIFVPMAKLGGATFFLVDTKKEETDEGTSTSPSVNWDLLWTVQASLLIPL